MEDIRNVIIDNKKDIQKLIHVYLKSLNLNYNKYSYKDIVKLLKDNFNFTVTEKDIMLYFEPTIEEEMADIMLQIKNLNL